MPSRHLPWIHAQHTNHEYSTRLVSRTHMPESRRELVESRADGPERQSSRKPGYSVVARHQYRTDTNALDAKPNPRVGPWHLAPTCFTDSSTSTEPKRRSSITFSGTCAGPSGSPGQRHTSGPGDAAHARATRRRMSFSCTCTPLLVWHRARPLPTIPSAVQGTVRGTPVRLVCFSYSWACYRGHTCDKIAVHGDDIYIHIYIVSEL